MISANVCLKIFGPLTSLSLAIFRGTCPHSVPAGRYRFLYGKVNMKPLCVVCLSLEKLVIYVYVGAKRLP